MKTRRDARVWVYQSLVAVSLRKRAGTLEPKEIAPEGITPAGLARVQAEMLALATWLEAKAEKLKR